MTLHSTIQRYIDRLKAKKPTADPDSRRLWQGLEVANINACCNAMRHAKAQWGITRLELTYEGIPVQKVAINYCPECGRKLS
ncbi:MAG: hypothetical protein M0R70_12755 [Nitrospirae bacterium]|nr:hypothetical protein [Nitrospirota bacterium]